MIVYGANEALTWARRIGLFQNVMRDVLGNRRKTFTWSGSVTDSVIGAFLTQNVSDLLSSRAYMEVASRWPAKYEKVMNDCDDCIGGHTASKAVSDTVDWEAVRKAPMDELIDAIKCRGLQIILSRNIKQCLEMLRHTNIRRLSLISIPSNIRPQLMAMTDDSIVMVLESLVGAVEYAEKEQEQQDMHVDVVHDKHNCVEHDVDSIALQHGSDDAVTLVDEVHHGVDNIIDMDDAVKILLKALEQSRKASPMDSTAMDMVCTRGWPGESLYKKRYDELSKDLLSLEWLRELPDEEAREFLMSIEGLGRKSVACIMLLTLGKKEFPVDTNVGRISARLGWIPLESSQAIEDMDDYAPEPEVHAYLRSRLLGFDIETLYELHYQMITLGKIFCSKQNPNCTACPMRSDCEYAMNNGPSLHGRKKERVSVKNSGKFSSYPPSDQVRDVEQQGMQNQLFSASGDAAGTVLNATALQYDDGNQRQQQSQRVHWKTKQKLERLEQQRSDREQMHSSLTLDELITQRKTGPRTPNLRQPRSRQASRTAHLDEDNSTADGTTTVFLDVDVLESNRDVATHVHVIDDHDTALLHADLPAIVTVLDDSGDNDVDQQHGAQIPCTPVLTVKSIPIKTTTTPSSIAPLSFQQQLPSLQRKDDSVLDECQRLQSLFKDMASITETLNILLDSNANQSRVHKNRMLELSLQALKIDSTLTIDSASTVATLAKKQYHLLARALHPDKCKIPGADNAFSAINRAITVIMDHVNPRNACNTASPPSEIPAVHDDRDGGDGRALGQKLSGGGILSQIVWNTSRLVLPAYVLSTNDYWNFPCQQASYDLECSRDYHLLFLPLHSIPTMKNDAVYSQSKTIPVSADRMYQIRCVLSSMLDVLDSQGANDDDLMRCGDDIGVTLPEKEEISHQDPPFVEGVLLVTVRAALWNRFPLNGTYFQINEVFADHSTILHPIKLQKSVLDRSRATAVYFGLGIHFLSKGMTQEEVAMMFSEGWVCFRSFDPVTRAPMILPHFLMPNVPTQSKSTWKNKHERAIARAEKESKRFAKVQRGFSQNGGPAVATSTMMEQGAAMSMQYGSSSGLVPFSESSTTSPSWLYRQPEKKERKLKKVYTSSEAAREAKSGKGRSRQFKYPIIRSMQRCGVCKACLNPHWKKACEKRRAEQIAHNDDHVA